MTQPSGFDFRASTPATSSTAEGGATKDQVKYAKKVELKKFSLQLERFNGKVEGWVNQFEEYATLGQWSNDEWASLLFLSLTGGTRLYFVRLPERENMAYPV